MPEYYVDNGFYGFLEINKCGEWWGRGKENKWRFCRLFSFLSLFLLLWRKGTFLPTLNSFPFLSRVQSRGGYQFQLIQINADGFVGKEQTRWGSNLVEVWRE
jgi:hypothetical protein